MLNRWLVATLSIAAALVVLYQLYFAFRPRHAVTHQAHAPVVPVTHELPVVKLTLDQVVDSAVHLPVRQGVSRQDTEEILRLLPDNSPCMLIQVLGGALSWLPVAADWEAPNAFQRDMFAYMRAIVAATPGMGDVEFVACPNDCWAEPESLLLRLPVFVERRCSGAPALIPFPAVNVSAEHALIRGAKHGALPWSQRASAVGRDSQQAAHQHKANFVATARCPPDGAALAPAAAAGPIPDSHEEAIRMRRTLHSGSVLVLEAVAASAGAPHVSAGCEDFFSIALRADIDHLRSAGDAAALTVLEGTLTQKPERAAVLLQHAQTLCDDLLSPQAIVRYGATVLRRFAAALRYAPVARPNTLRELPTGGAGPADPADRSDVALPAEAAQSLASGEAAPVLAAASPRGEPDTYPQRVATSPQSVSPATLHAWIIHYRPLKERRWYLERALAMLGFEKARTHWMDEIDKNSLDPKRVATDYLYTPERYDFIAHQCPRDEKHLFISGYRLTNSHIATAFTHYDSWKAMVENGLPMGLFIEDDAVPLHHDVWADRFFNYMKQLPPNWDFVMLPDLFWEPNNIFWLPDRDGVQNVFLKNEGRAATAYLLSRQGAQRMLERVLPFTMAVDFHMQYPMKYYNMQGYHIYPALFHEGIEFYGSSWRPEIKSDVSKLGQVANILPDQLNSTLAPRYSWGDSWDAGLRVLLRDPVGIRCSNVTWVGAPWDSAKHAAKHAAGTHPRSLREREWPLCTDPGWRPRRPCRFESYLPASFGANRGVDLAAHAFNSDVRSRFGCAAVNTTYALGDCPRDYPRCPRLRAANQDLAVPIVDQPQTYKTLDEQPRVYRYMEFLRVAAGAQTWPFFEALAANKSLVLDWVDQLCVRLDFSPKGGFSLARFDALLSLLRFHKFRLWHRSPAALSEAVDGPAATQQFPSRSPICKLVLKMLSGAGAPPAAHTCHWDVCFLRVGT